MHCVTLVHIVLSALPEGISVGRRRLLVYSLGGHLCYFCLHAVTCCCGAALLRSRIAMNRIATRPCWYGAALLRGCAAVGILDPEPQ